MQGSRLLSQVQSSFSRPYWALMWQNMVSLSFSFQILFSLPYFDISSSPPLSSLCPSSTSSLHLSITSPSLSPSLLPLCLLLLLFHSSLHLSLTSLFSLSFTTLSSPLPLPLFFTPLSYFSFSFSLSSPSLSSLCPSSTSSLHLSLTSLSPSLLPLCLLLSLLHLLFTSPSLSPSFRPLSFFHSSFVLSLSIQISLYIASSHTVLTVSKQGICINHNISTRTIQIFQP